MRDSERSKEQLIIELTQLRQRIAELELLLVDEKRSSKLMKSLHECIWVLDNNDCTTFVNPRMAEVLGYTEEEMLGKPVFSFMDGEWVKIAVEHMKRRKQGIKEQVDAEFVRKDGSRMYALLETSPILDQNGEYIGSIAGVQDITQHRQLEEQIQQQRDFLTDVLKSLPHPFYIVDANDYTIKMANPAAAFDKISERSTCYSLTHGRTEPCTGTEHVCPLEEIKKTKKPDIVEHIHNDRDGTPTHVEVHAYPVLDEEGNVTQIIEYALDITERKQVEEARVGRAAAQARAEELKRSRQRIVNAQEAIRRDIAQQLHGSVQNRIVVLIHQLEEIQQTTMQEYLSGRLTEVSKNLADLLENHLRPIAYQLYPSILRRGLVAALQSLRDRLETILPIEMTIDEEFSRQERKNSNFVPEPVRLAAYRITEEALGNVLKHAYASKANVSLGFSLDGSLCLTIRDNGQGFDAEKVTIGLGTLFMQDYAEMVGGNCAIHTVRKKGTEVSITLPLGETYEVRQETTLP